MAGQLVTRLDLDGRTAARSGSARMRRTPGAVVTALLLIGAVLANACAGAPQPAASQAPVQPAAAAPAPAAAGAPTCTTPYRIRYAARNAASDPLGVNWTVAEKMGYFKANCVTVERLKIDAAEVAVMAQQAEVAVSGPDVMIGLLQKEGPNLPIVSFYNTIPYPHFRLLVLPDSPIKSLNDLAGKTVNTLTNAFSGTGVFKAQLKSLGIEANIVSLPVGAAVAQALTKGEVVALNDVDTNQVMYNTLLKTTLRVIPMLPALAAASGSVMVARKDVLQSNKANFVRYLKAYNAGQLFVNKNSKAAAAIHIDAYPELIIAGETRDAAIVRIQGVLDGRLASAKIRTDSWAQPQVYGWMYDTSWQVWVDLNPELKKPFDFHPAINNDLVKESWEFDQAAVISQAEKFKP